MDTGEYDLLINQGATYERVIRAKDDSGEYVDLSEGYSARSQIRRHKGDAEPQHDIEPEIIPLEPEGNGILISISDTVTAGFDFERGVWDLELIDGTGKVTRILEGIVIVSKEVTR